MGENAYHVTDRRPIAARRFAIFQQMAASLARAHVTANTISVAGMVCGLLAGICLYFTDSAGPLIARILWLAAAGLVQLRLLANMLDGMVAIASATASKVGELFNEMPDRISDAATLIGLGYAAGGSRLLDGPPPCLRFLPPTCDQWAKQPGPVRISAAQWPSSSACSSSRSPASFARSPRHNSSARRETGVWESFAPAAW